MLLILPDVEKTALVQILNIALKGKNAAVPNSSEILGELDGILWKLNGNVKQGNNLAFGQLLDIFLQSSGYLLAIIFMLIIHLTLFLSVLDFYLVILNDIFFSAYL